MKDHEINNTIDRIIDPKNRLLPYTRSLDACAEFERTITERSDCVCYLIQLDYILGKFDFGICVTRFKLDKISDKLDAIQKALEQKNNLTLDKPPEKDYREPQSDFTED